MSTSVIEARLTELDVPYRVLGHLPARTAIGEAMMTGVRADCVLKSLMAVGHSGYTLLVVPASRRLDMRLVRDALADPHARLATEEELARDFPRFELGALPPLGSVLGVPMVVDPSALFHDRVAFADGCQDRSILAPGHELFQGESMSVRQLTVDRHSLEPISA